MTVQAPIADAIALLTAARQSLVDEADRQRPGFRKSSLIVRSRPLIRRPGAAYAASPR